MIDSKMMMSENRKNPRPKLNFDCGLFLYRIHLAEINREKPIYLRCKQIDLVLKICNNCL